MQARRISRELTLLSLSQLPSHSEKLQAQQLQDLVLAAVRTLTSEAQDTLETASAELKQGNDRLLTSETRAADVESARAMVTQAIELTQAAINGLGTALELPELIQLANQKEVRDYALQLLGMVNTHRSDIDSLLNQVMVDWQVKRLPQVDRDILRIAITEIMFLGVPDY
ncbi:MAG: transcription antitermination protein NusB [Cyanothece sp. SIO1E1]|nr:transcription antitermination protein NusB [Cyanothece sp. SIO1E1]